MAKVYAKMPNRRKKFDKLGLDRNNHTGSEFLLYLAMPLPLILEQIIARAKGRDRHILLADAEDERMLIAARIAHDEHIARITLIGEPEQVKEAAGRANVSVEDFKIWHPSTCPVMDALSKVYLDVRAGKVASLSDARQEIMADPLLMGAVAIHNGDADGMVAGSLSTTASVIRAGLRGIGLRSDLRVLSSMFLIILPKIPGNYSPFAPTS